MAISMPPAARSRRRRSSAARGPLTRGRIIEAAVALIEEQGPDGLSMRRLGAALGVEGMAIYHHYGSRDELLGAISEHLLDPLRELELDGDWRMACHRFAVALREIARRYPSSFRLLGLQPFDTAAALSSVERLLGALVAAGFGPADALAIYRATVSYARGFALAEVAGFTVDASRPEGRRRLDALPTDEFPILGGRTAELAALGADAAYELGLQAMLRGLGGPAPRTGKPARKGKAARGGGL
jgi:AcrR family transcriptional regulator